MTDKPQNLQEDSPEVRKRPASEDVETAPQEAQVEEAAAPAPQVASPAEGPRPGRRVVDVSIPKPEPVPEPEPIPVDPALDGLDDQFSAMMSQAFAGGGAPPTQVELDEGQQVTGKVVHIGEDNVFVDVGTKHEGYVARRELETDGELSVAVGDELELYVVGFSASGVELTRGLSFSSDSRRGLESAYSGRIPVEGKVVSKNKGGFEVTVMGERAFCPISQIEMAFTEDPDVHIGQTYRFLVTKYEAKGKNIDVVVSRAELEREERRAKQGETFATLEVGQMREGLVRKIMPFGVFVDLGGVDGLIHISELSWDRVEDASTIVKPGDTVNAKVISLKNMDQGPDKVRVGLSLKATQGNPWDNIRDNFSEGEVYEGEVVRMEHFGAFIQLSPGIDGLVHISEMSLGRIRHPKDVVSVGQRIRVQVLSIDSGRKRLSLSIKSMSADPWESAHERYGEGQEVEGTVENIEDFGVFVSLEAGITALIPQSELATQRGRDPRMDFRLGQTVKARVLSIDQIRQRLTLTRRDPDAVRESAPPRAGSAPRRDDRGGRGGGRPQRRERDNKVQWREDEQKSGGMGTFADLFSKKLRKGKD